MWEREALGQFYVDLLQGRFGLRAQLDDDLDVVFEVSGGARLFIMNGAPGVPSALRVFVGFGTTDVEAARGAEVCRVVGARRLAVKVTYEDDVVEVAYESFVAPEGCRPDPALLEQLLPQVIDLLLDTAGDIAAGLAA
jgi:hypothetical protein